VRRAIEGHFAATVKGVVVHDVVVHGHVVLRQGFLFDLAELRLQGCVGEVGLVLHLLCLTVRLGVEELVNSFDSN